MDRKRQLPHVAYSSLLDGVVFAISGVVNPERGQLRDEALEMGATYRPDWDSDCTLLVCAFPNTPKFKSVKAQGGTIVSKDWVRECYKKKDLVDINNYLLFSGGPWKKKSEENGTDTASGSHTSKPSAASKDDTLRPAAASGHDTLRTTAAAGDDTLRSTAALGDDTSEPAAAPGSKQQKSTSALEDPRSWFSGDLEAAISWLEQQENKPQKSELKRIAAEGLLACLEDAIESLRDNKGTAKVMETWGFIPRAVTELQALVNQRMPREAIVRQAKEIKDVYSNLIAASKMSASDDRTQLISDEDDDTKGEVTSSAQRTKNPRKRKG